MRPVKCNRSNCARMVLTTSKTNTRTCRIGKKEIDGVKHHGCPGTMQPATWEEWEEYESR